jgi:hypothetical protein
VNWLVDDSPHYLQAAAKLGLADVSPGLLVQLQQVLGG